MSEEDLSELNVFTALDNFTYGSVLTNNNVSYPGGGGPGVSTDDNSVLVPSPSEDTQELALALLLSVVIVITVVGNTLVILAVLTTRRLRTVTNCFVMSLAVADWLVGIFVMPPAVAFRLIGVWELGWILCDVWVSLDILLCTASILSLCAISVDRYLAVTQPLSYSRKRRSKRLAFTMILAVWISSALITCPPMFGWYEPGRHKEKTCRYNRNTGYVIFSAMGSFFIPMVVMVYVYVRISCVVAKRHDQLANIEGRTRVSYYNKSQKLVLTSTKDESDIERGSSECEDQIRCTSLTINETALDGAASNNHTSTTTSTGTTTVELRKPTNLSRSLRSSLNYSFKHEHHSLPAQPHHHQQRHASLYATSLTTTRPKTEGAHHEMSVMNFEPATRVSSFRRETKTAQTLSIVVGGFILCWLPFFIYYLLTPFISAGTWTEVVMGYLTWLGWINSAINPFIYAFYSPDFRIAFWRLTFKHFNRNRREDIAFQHK